MHRPYYDTSSFVYIVDDIINYVSRIQYIFHNIFKISINKWVIYVKLILMILLSIKIEINLYLLLWVCYNFIKVIHKIKELMKLKNFLHLLHKMYRVFMMGIICNCSKMLSSKLNLKLLRILLWLEDQEKVLLGKSIW